jgi:hypothetical protein
MSDEEKESVNEPVTEAAAQASESEAEHDVRQEEAREVEQPKRKDADYNWNEARRKMQELERRAQEQDELIRRLSTSNAPKDDDELDKLSDDDIITVKQHKQMAARIAKQVAEEVVKQRESLTVEDRINAKFPDFDQVVTPESVENFKNSDPELAELLRNEQDPYKQAVLVYKQIKRNQPIQQKVSQNNLERKKAVENSQKPLSVQAASKQSALGNAGAFENGLTPELKKQLYSEMQQCIKRA